MYNCPNCISSVVPSGLDTYECHKCRSTMTGDYLRAQIINQPGNSSQLDLQKLSQFQFYPSGSNPNQMKSDPCESPTREVRKELTVNVARSVQISEWNSCADRVINTIDNYTAALTNEDKKQIKSRLDNILKLLSSK